MTARVDQWLWAVRVTSTRTDATALCSAGHVKVNGRAAKPATTVAPGDRVAAFVHGRQRELEVVETIGKRVGAAVAAGCFVDHSPAPPAREERAATRERGAGRPTKRERRDIDRLRGR